MDNRSKDLMRMDRRLLERPGWITPEELERELAELPDVSDKIDTRESDPSGEESGTSAPANDPAPFENTGSPGAASPSFNSSGPSDPRDSGGGDAGGGFGA